MSERDGRGVDDEGGVGIEKRLGDEVKVIVEMDVGTFTDELFGEERRCAVITGDVLALSQEIADEGTHADATGTDEIEIGELIEVHVAELKIKLTRESKSRVGVGYKG